MDERQLNDSLFAKMFAEQQDYRAWLMTLPPDEILDHAAEFVVREDILVELEAFDLPADQAAALLASPTSLADIYREWGKVDTHYMEDIRDVIENLAEDRAGRNRGAPLGVGGLESARAAGTGAESAQFSQPGTIDFALCAVSIAFRGQKWYNISMEFYCGIGRTPWQNKTF